MRRLACALVAPAVLSAAPAAGAQPAPAAPAPPAPAPAAPAPAAPAEPRPRSPTFHDASHGWLRVTRAPAFTHPALGTFDLYCPQTPHPSPFVVVVLDPAQPRAEGERSSPTPRPIAPSPGVTPTAASPCSASCAAGSPG